MCDGEKAQWKDGNGICFYYNKLFHFSIFIFMWIYKLIVIITGFVLRLLQALRARPCVRACVSAGV